MQTSYTPLTIKVGTTNLYTSVETLNKCRSRLSKMINSIPEEHRSRPLYLDRNPSTFRSILYYLRTERLMIPAECTLHEVLSEARFFGIRPMILELEQIISGIPTELLQLPDYYHDSTEALKQFDHIQRLVHRGKKKKRRKRAKH
ncbi:hypothetical protein P9112_003174 [Eukaryota sp. TZLM1-RC]